MTMDTLTTVADEETVKEYVSIIQNVEWNWQTVMVSLAILVIGLLIVRLLLRGVNTVLTRSKVPPTLHAIIRSMLRVFLDLVVVLTVAAYLGIPITSFVALISLAGLAISLALQGVLSNLAGGFLILAGHPFEVGDFVEYDGIIGTVREIRMQHTRIETLDCLMVYVPNSKLAGDRMINYTETGMRKVDLPVYISYETTPEEVRKCVMKAVKKMPEILTNPEPLVLFNEYKESYIQYNIWVWLKGENFLKVRFGFPEILYSCFREAGIRMPYPHLNVHMDVN